MRSKLWKRTLALWLVACTAIGLFGCGLQGNDSGTGIVINEIVSSNGESYEDETYGSPDWI